jgi:diaminopimelate decarboxylase
MNLPITAKINKKGHLTIGGLDSVDLAKKFGTPLFVLDEETLRFNCRQYADAFCRLYDNFEIIYANKALCAVGVLKILKSEGFGMDVASGGELFTALKAGCEAKTIYFHGNNKTKDEIIFGIKSKIRAFIVDNFDELSSLEEISKKLNQKVSVLLRVNPGIEAHTHDFIKTGTIDSKFGIPKSHVLKAADRVIRSKNLIYKGLHSHIGSQIFEQDGYIAEAGVLMELFSFIKKQLGAESSILNLGGGIGIAYTKKDPSIDISLFVSKIVNTVKDKANELDLKPPKIILEPGRSIIGTAVITLYEVGVVKDIPKIKKYVIVDGGMSDNPRPILYGAKYDALVANKANLKPAETVTIAGRACEGGDILVKGIKLPKTQKGDIIAVACTGAYNYSMASNYNRFLKPAFINVADKQAKILIKRENYEDLVRNDL